jgi:hypothetical protein
MPRCVCSVFNPSLMIPDIFYGVRWIGSKAVSSIKSHTSKTFNHVEQDLCHQEPFKCIPYETHVIGPSASGELSHLQSLERFLGLIG